MTPTVIVWSAFAVAMVACVALWVIEIRRGLVIPSPPAKVGPGWAVEPNTCGTCANWKRDYSGSIWGRCTVRNMSATEHMRIVLHNNEPRCWTPVLH